MISQEELKLILDYDMTTGIFYWKIKPARNVRVGDEAGCFHKSTGYIMIRYQGIGYYAHTLALMYVYGEWVLWPDHKDRNKINNSIFNLRKAGPSLNGANRGLNKNNKTGFKGVHVNRHGSFEATIKYEGRRIYLGSYKTPEETHSAYIKRAIELFGVYHNEGVAL